MSFSNIMENINQLNPSFDKTSYTSLPASWSIRSKLATSASKAIIATIKKTSIGKRYSLSMKRNIAVQIYKYFLPKTIYTHKSIKQIVADCKLPTLNCKPKWAF